MAHYQQLKFVENFSKIFFQNKKITILEIGSWDVNGTLRSYFNNVENYIGLDLEKGPGVDIVYDGEKFPLKEMWGKIDLSISCECFEHNPFYLKNFHQMINCTNSDGVVLFTCATIGRHEHGTTATNPDHSPASAKIFDYYKNLKPSNFKTIIKKNLFYKHKFYKNDVSKDLYFLGIKSKKYIDDFNKFDQLILSQNTLVKSLNINFILQIKNFIKYLLINIFPFIIGDFLVRKIRNFLMRNWKK